MFRVIVSRLTTACFGGLLLLGCTDHPLPERSLQSPTTAGDASEQACRQPVLPATDPSGLAASGVDSIDLAIAAAEASVRNDRHCGALPVLDQQCRALWLFDTLDPMALHHAGADATQQQRAAEVNLEIAASLSEPWRDLARLNHDLATAIPQAADAQDEIAEALLARANEEILRTVESAQSTCG